MDRDEKIKNGHNQLLLKLKNKNNINLHSDLMKIPVEHLYKEALREIGEQEAYIDELKSTINDLRAELNNPSAKAEKQKLLKELKREELYQNQKNVLKKCREENKKLKNTITELITKVVSYSQTINDLQSKLQDRESQNN
jgi:BMFP domain-containing protein YqiC